MAWQGRHPSIQSRQLAPAVDKPPAHRTSLWTAPAGSVACPPLPGRCLRPDALRLPEQPIEIGTKTLPMATAPHHANGRLKPAQAAPRHRTLAINSDRVRKPIIRPSCLGEFEWPQVGEFEAAIGECAEGDVLGLRLGIQREQVDLTNFAASKVDDPDATGLACSFSYPAHLADTTRATNHGPGFRVQCDKGRELGALIFVPVPRPQPLEDGAFDDGENAATVRLERIAVNVRLL